MTRTHSSYRRIYAVVRRIPRGCVATYGQVAALAGLGEQARQVGYALHALDNGSDVPWHRVINARGEVSPRSELGYEEIQRQLLEGEGVEFDARSRVDLETFRWEPGAWRRRRSASPTRRVLQTPSVTPATMGRVLRRLAARYDIEQFVTAHGREPYRVLIGCVLSLRTKDDVSFPATERLFVRARTPGEMVRLRATTIARLIYPVGFYRRKAEQIHALSRQLLEAHGGRVPAELEALLELPGVGRKTANLVRTIGFGKPGICVDTHVHRITNRLGWVATGHPDETEMALRRLLPRKHWIPINEILVRHGQSVCKPISPVCSMCDVAPDCPRRGVGRSR